MRSIRTQITTLAIVAVVVSVSIATIIAAISVSTLGRRDADRTMVLLAGTADTNLNSYLGSVEQSARTVADLVQESLADDATVDLAGEVDRSRTLFEKVADQTEGVLTYYFRIDPKVSDEVRGFWYTNLDGAGPVEHEVTDITRYDPSDTSQLVWFTVPKATGEPCWLDPYVTDNLDERVISYNIPVYRDGTFLGVIGIEIDYDLLASEVGSITCYEHGYAFVCDEEGNLVYHPQIDVTTLTEDTRPAVPEGLLGDDGYVTYTFDGTRKRAAWLPLVNGMRLYVTAPLDEINREWHAMVALIVACSVVVLVVVSVVAMRSSGRLTRPLLELTAAAEQVDAGNYDVRLDYDADNEVGTLTRTFMRLVENMRSHIAELNKRVFVDALTSVRNKGAYSICIQELQDEIDAGNRALEFGVCVFDCDNLKQVNDAYGHDKGDVYLRGASDLICGVFKHSPVFRIGGDEFSVVLRGQDFERRDELVERFRRECDEICREAAHPWERVSVTCGMAVYDAELDPAAIDTMRRADKVMYLNKRERKAGRDAS